MRCPRISRSALIGAIALAALALSSLPAESGYRRVTINGMLIHPQVVMQIERAIGMRLRGGAYRWDGRFLYDRYGHYVPLSMGRGRAVQGPRAGMGGGGGTPRSGRITNTVIDPTGGCEGGSCVNILD